MCYALPHAAIQRPREREMTATATLDAAQTATNPLRLGKDRSPASVIGLSIVTLGIYYLVWYYKINAEMRRHDPKVKVSPGLALLAQFIPIANLVGGYSTAARIRQMQLDDGATHVISPGVALLWLILFGIGYPLYIASNLREHWNSHS